jgi:RraA family protein
MNRNNVKSVNTNLSYRKRVLALKTALLSDALGKNGAMDHDMRCVSAKCQLAGPAATLRVHTADVLMVAKAVSVCSRGSVLVIDGQGELNTALWGSIISIAARVKGIEGVVIDGAVRDLANIRDDHFPVFARGVVPNAGGHEYAGELNVPIQCAGVVVNPGDWVVGDEDGVVVIPLDRLPTVLRLAERISQVEKQIEKAVRRGKDLTSLLGYDDVLKRKSRETFLPQMRLTVR